MTDNHVRMGTCPACRRMEDNLPAGIATFTGDYFSQHEMEILDIIKSEESRSKAKNPLGRIMEIAQEGNVLTVSTTEDKLAQKLGREVYKAHKGELALPVGPRPETGPGALGEVEKQGEGERLRGRKPSAFCCSSSVACLKACSAAGWGIGRSRVQVKGV